MCTFLFFNCTRTRTYDIVIYGGTSAGVAAAVQAARMDKSVVLIETDKHVGGLTSSGLGKTDTGDPAVIGGVSREFYQRIKKYYDNPEAWAYGDQDSYGSYNPDSDAMWRFEPKVAEHVFEQMLDEENVPVLYGEHLDRNNRLEIDDWEIKRIHLASGRKINGKMFIDATYEGDLMAEAGVSYTIGRESNQKYNETLNGVQKARSTNHQLKKGVDPYVVPGDPESGLLPYVHGNDPGKDGQGDHRIQAYCFRMCLTDMEENKVSFQKPENYDEQDYELLFRNFKAGENSVPWLPGMMPNRKTDTNNRTGFSTDFIGQNYDYPEADYETREQIIKAHENYQRGLMWTLANHPRVPEHIRNEVSKWGLAKDEFVDNNNWPHELYIREARRMIGDYVVTEHDCKRQRLVEDPVGLGSYNMDSHNCQRYVTKEGFARNEGNIEVSPRGAYMISYGALVPKKDEIANLFVPVCLSASHIAYGSIRMEPVFMILGQSAATAAAIAVEDEVAVQDVDYAKLREQLLKDGQILDLPPEDLPQPDIKKESLEGIVIDDADALPRGSWVSSTSVHPYVGGNYLHDQNGGKGSRWAHYEVMLPQQGWYEVRMSYTPHQNRATNVPVTIHHGRGTETVTVNQQKAPPIDNLWISLGEFYFTSKHKADVFITNKNTDGYVILDAVQFLEK